MNLGDALQFLREYDNEASAMCTRVITAQWNFATNVTEENRRRMVKLLLIIKYEILIKIQSPKIVISLFLFYRR